MFIYLYLLKPSRVALKW